MTPHQLLTAAGWQPLGGDLWRSPHSGFPLHEAEAVAAQTRINRMIKEPKQKGKPITSDEKRLLDAGWKASPTRKGMWKSPYSGIWWNEQRAILSELMRFDQDAPQPPNEQETQPQAAPCAKEGHSK